MAEDSETHAVWRIEERGGDAVRIWWLGIASTPTPQDIDAMAAHILAHDVPCIVHVEHTRPPALIPSLRLVSHVRKLLVREQDFIKRNLQGTAIQALALDPITCALRDIALALYRPRKPVCITAQPHKVAEFLCDCGGVP